LKKLLETTIKKITPSLNELKKESEFAEKIKEKINLIGGNFESIELVGSIARNTHLRGDRDLDIFILFPKNTPREEFEKEGLRIGKEVFKGHKWEKAYSEHPYIRGEIEGYKVEIVPAYKILDAGLLQSAVDRSVFHAEHIIQNLKPGQEKEVRLMKQFMKGTKCYGADLSSNGFPGYVAELLILKYGDFKNALKEISQWKNGEVIDTEIQYTPDEATKKFNTHLIVIDPVDKNRNVAAALSLNQFARFIGASRAFLKKPSPNFFFPKNHKPWPAKKLRAFLKKTELVAIEMGYPNDVVEDVMWGQLRRFSKKIANLCEEKDFSVKRSEEWLEHQKRCIIMIELESTILQKVKVEEGPEVIDEKNSEAFLKAHPKIISGPRIENARWIVEVERNYSDIKILLKDLLKKMKKQEREGIRKGISKKCTILNEKEIVELYSKNKEFQQFLTAYLKGKEIFLDY